MPGLLSRFRRPWRSMGLTHPGLKRSNNQDAILAMPEKGLWAVADGMGGHQKGELASELVIKSMREHAGTGDDLTAAILDAHRQVSKHPDAETTKMGSTAVALRIQASSMNYELAWVGDSRAYLIRDGEMRQLSVDHTLVNELFQKGALTREEADAHPEKSVLSRAVGRANEGKLQIDRKLGQAKKGDKFLLCSDGLHGVVEDSAILASASSIWAVDYKTRTLLDLALKNGAPDNVSVILVEVA